MDENYKKFLVAMDGDLFDVMDKACETSTVIDALADISENFTVDGKIIELSLIFRIVRDRINEVVDDIKHLRSISKTMLE